MALAGEIVADVSRVFLNANDFAESISYTATGSASASTVTANVRRDAYEADDSEDGNVTIRRIRLDVAATDVTDPQEGDTVTVDGVDWGHEAVEAYAGGMYSLRYYRRERSAVSGDGLQRPEV